jgi:hypothetical protein
LDFDATRPYERWGVVVRHRSLDGYTTFTKCVACVDLRGVEDYRKTADRAVRVVRDWLVAHHATNDFDAIDYLLTDGECIDIHPKAPVECNGCDGSCGCAKIQ